MEILYEWWKKQPNLTKRIFKLMLIGVSVVFLCGIYYFSQTAISPLSNVQSFNVEYDKVESNVEVPVSSQESTMIYIDIKGAVAKPGVYKLPSGSRLFDLIEEAEGFLDEAYTANVNQAQLLSDQMLIYIYTQEEWEALQEIEVTNVTTESSGSLANLININQADVSQLQQLPGIGKGKAEAIVLYRQENGAFTSIEEIQQVKGIGASTFEKLAPLITVSP